MIQRFFIWFAPVRKACFYVPCLLFFACTDTPQTADSSQVTADDTNSAVPSTDTSAGPYFPHNPAPEGRHEQYEARLRFDDFSLILHNFYLYYVDPVNGTLLTEDPEQKPHDKNQSGKIIYVQKDTFLITEDIDNHLYKTLFQIIPHHPDDRFKLSMGYLSTLYQVDTSLNRSDEEDNSEVSYFPEATQLISVPDSAGYYFRVLTFDEQSRKADSVFFKKDLLRVKQKYQLRDTSVILPGDYEIEVTLARNRKLWMYENHSYLFRIDRYRGSKLMGSKFLQVEIAKGC